MAEIILPPEHYNSRATGQSTSSQVRPNTAAVRRDDTNYIYTAGGLTGGHNGIVETIAGSDLGTATQKILTINGDVVRTVENTPLAATLVWDNSQINVYYLTQTTGGAFLEEACQRADNDWIRGSLGEALLNEGVRPSVDSTVAAWTHNEEIQVYFKSTTDGQREMTMAKYSPESSSWQINKIAVNY